MHDRDADARNADIREIDFESQPAYLADPLPFFPFSNRISLTFTHSLRTQPHGQRGLFASNLRNWLLFERCLDVLRGDFFANRVNKLCF